MTRRERVIAVLMEFEPYVTDGYVHYVTEAYDCDRSEFQHGKRLTPDHRNDPLFDGYPGDDAVPKIIGVLADRILKAVLGYTPGGDRSTLVTPRERRA